MSHRSNKKKETKQPGGPAYLAPVISAFELGVVLLCALLTWKYGSFELSYPWISDLGNATPQIYVFGSGLTLAALARVVLIYCRYVQLQSLFLDRPYRCVFGWNTLIMTIGLLACVFQGLLGWWSDITQQTVHAYLSGTYFALMTVYQLMHTALIWWAMNHQDEGTASFEFTKLCPRPSLNRFAWYWLGNILTVVTGTMVIFSRIPIEVGAAPIAESVLIGALSLYTLPYYYELYSTSFPALFRVWHMTS